MKQIIDQRIVHGSAELGMGMQNQGHGRARSLLALVARFDTPRRAGKNNIRHGVSPDVAGQGRNFDIAQSRVFTGLFF
jgi:hypothetical protein